MKKKFPDTLLLFLTPPSAEELERRLTGRGTETGEAIESRLARAAEESEFMGEYDYIVINDDLEECADNVHRLIQLQHQTSASQSEFIQKIQKELRERKEKRG